ncbi:MAG: hypothetical protein JW763_07035 [candidate division Zixibacteria bacterium]|nr:hypothetical protein [candidate division Zixibacteria bacterium]
METLIGKLTASLVECDQSRIGELIERLNTNINPPEPIGEDDVYIRAMYIVSDHVNSYGGCFPVDEHDGLLSLLIDAPVLIGHRKDSLPIARNFHAEKVTRDGANWIKVYFYWLKASTHGAELCRNIDGGIYKECSISFIFSFPECTICGRDIRECPHRPFVEYDTPAGRHTAAFNYRKIEKVLETSLVYRGSVENTSVTGDLFFTKSTAGQSHERPVPPNIRPRYRLWYLGRLSTKGEVRIMPAYEAAELFIHHSSKGLHVYDPVGTEMANSRLSGFLNNLNWPDGDYLLDCRLIGYRGKERQKVADLAAYLDGRKSPVRRLEIRVVDMIKRNGSSPGQQSGRERLTALESLFGDDTSLMIPSRVCKSGELRDEMTKATTRRGIEIHDLESPRRFLLTHRKLIPGIMIPCDDERQSDLMFCQVDGTMKPVEAVHPIDAVGCCDVVEMECSAVAAVDNHITITSGVYSDWYGAYQQIDDISLLLEDIPNNKKMHYALYTDDRKQVILEVQTDNSRDRFLIHSYSAELLNRGRCFAADRIDSGAITIVESIGEGEFLSVSTHQDGFSCTATGVLAGKIRIQPMILNGRHRYLLSVTTHPQNKPELL